MLRERDLVQKELQRITRINGEHAETLALKAEQIRNLEQEIKHYLKQAQRQRALLTQVERERDKNAEQVLTLEDRLEQAHGNDIFHRE